MAHKIGARPIGWGRTAWYGAEAGMALSFLYALAFVGYAAARSALDLLAAPRPDGGLAGTLLATWISLAVPALGLAALLGLLAAPLGALTACVLRALLSGLRVAHDPARAAAIGIAVCLIVSLGLWALVARGLGVAWSPATAPTLTFWLVLPLAIYVAAGGTAGWRVAKSLSS